MMSKNDELQMEHLETSGIKEINQKLVDISFTELTAKTDNLFSGLKFDFLTSKKTYPPG